MEWISVKDRLPKKNINVLVVAKGEVHEGSIGRVFWCIPNFDGYCNNDITHWMPLPEPPGKE